MTGLTHKDLQLRTLRQAETHRVLGTGVGKDLVQMLGALVREIHTIENLRGHKDPGLPWNRICAARQKAQLVLNEIQGHRDKAAEQQSRLAVLEESRQQKALPVHLAGASGERIVAIAEAAVRQELALQAMEDAQADGDLAAERTAEVEMQEATGQLFDRIHPLTPEGRKQQTGACHDQS